MFYNLEPNNHQVSQFIFKTPNQVSVKFNWIQLELLERRRALASAFYLFIHFSSRAVESVGLFYAHKTKLLFHTLLKKSCLLFFSVFGKAF